MNIQINPSYPNAIRTCQTSQSQGNIYTRYHQLPYFNFYQYPPAEKVSLDKKNFLVQKLALEEEISGRKVFTIFVDVPYCKSHCNSCLLFKESLPTDVNMYSLLEDYLDSIIIQIQNYASTIRFYTSQCGAVYIGGGTASLLAYDQVARLIETIKTSFSINSDIEITLEGNPQDFSREYLERINKSGVNRLSIGIQSFQDRFLRYSLNSPHNSADSRDSIKNALQVDFNTVNIDLLYGIPGQTFADWYCDLRTTLEFEPKSVTIYPYIIHEGSNSEKMITSGFLEKPIDSEIMHEWYLFAAEKMKKRGYLELRKGNFFKLGHEQMYEILSYMQNNELVGIGAGAYSFINRFLFRASDNPKYFKTDIQNKLFQIGDYQSSQATDKNMMERYVIHNLYSNSLSRADFYTCFGQDVLTVFAQIFKKLQMDGLVIINNQYVKLTDMGTKWIINILYEFYSNSLKKYHGSIN